MRCLRTQEDPVN